MHYGTVCSGIECFSVAAAALNWTPNWFAEIDPYCCALLKEKYPHVPNLGNIEEIPRAPCVDVVVAGTPCQSFSIQGNRAGMDDARGRLAIRFCEILATCRPRWVVWENVPNVLGCNKGRDFRCFLSSLAQCGYGFAYRVLDARYFGVAQRRRRVFVVGHYRDWRPAAGVLFDGTQHRPDAYASYEDKYRRATPSVDGVAFGYTGDATPKIAVELVPTLKAGQGGEGVGVLCRGKPRRLTITEWERLQGLPDGYTRIDGWGDTHRKRAIGNGFCVPVLRWIASRIEAAHAAGV